MVPNDAVTNVLRAHNFTFKRQSDRMMLWRQRGSQRRVQVRRNGSHDPDYVKTLLRQAGLTIEEIDAFFRSINC